MRTPIKCALWALSLVMLQSCSNRDEAYQPAAIPPVVVKVQTFIPLPADATRACAEPELSEPIETDVQAIGAGAQWKGTSRCNAMKLCIIGEIEKAGPGSATAGMAAEVCRQRVWPETAGQYRSSRKPTKWTAGRTGDVIPSSPPPPREYR